jgi:hypothetical protein
VGKPIWLRYRLEFVPKMIEADDGEDFVAFIRHQIEADWDEK